MSRKGRGGEEGQVEGRGRRVKRCEAEGKERVTVRVRGQDDA